MILVQKLKVIETEKGNKISWLPNFCKWRSKAN